MNGMIPSPKEKNCTIEKENSKTLSDNKRTKEFKLREPLQEPSPSRRRRKLMPNVQKSEPRLRPPNWPSRKPVRPKSALREKPLARLRPLKYHLLLPRTSIAARKRKLQQNHERTRVLPKKWYIRRKIEMKKILALKSRMVPRPMSIERKSH